MLRVQRTMHALGGAGMVLANLLGCVAHDIDPGIGADMDMRAVMATGIEANMAAATVDIVSVDRVPGTGVEPMLPPRVPDAGDQGLVAQALADGSNSALIMILARNPGTPEADAALGLLAGRTDPDPAAIALAVAGADADVVTAFDAARLAGSAAAWREFLAAHGSHPLATFAWAALAAL